MGHLVNWGVLWVEEEGQWLGSGGEAVQLESNPGLWQWGLRGESTPWSQCCSVASSPTTDGFRVLRGDQGACVVFVSSLRRKDRSHNIWPTISASF